MNAVAVVVLGVLWLVIVVRLCTAWGSAQQRVTTLAFVCFALSGTFVIRPVRYGFDAATGVGDLSILVGHVFAMLGMVVALELAVGMAPRRRAYVRGAQTFLATAVMAMTVLFLIIPRRLDEPDFGYWHARHGAVVSYQLLDLVCLGVGLCFAVAILFPQWRSAGRGALRNALLFLWLAAAIGLGYDASRLWYVIAHGFGFVAQGDRPLYGAMTFLLLYGALLAAGVGGLIRVMHSWGRFARRYVGYHRLRGLWTDLTGAVPSAVLEPPPGPLASLFSLELRLYRLEVEIRDAQVELASYVPQWTRDAAREALDSAREEREGALDACILLMALNLQRNGAERTESPAMAYWSADASLDGEMESLLTLRRLMDARSVVDVAANVFGTMEGLRDSRGFGNPLPGPTLSV